MRTKPQPLLSGPQLVDDFRTALISQATAQAAHQQAADSEHSVIAFLAAANSGHILNPASLTDTSQATLTRASLDAHIKKVQAEQIQSLSSAQLNQLIVDARTTYTGRKIRVSIIDKKQNPLEAVWFDQQAGYRQSAPKKITVQGTIQEVLLDQNALLIKPNFMAHVMNSALQYYIVYIINPSSAEPMVSITL